MDKQFLEITDASASCLFADPLRELLPANGPGKKHGYAIDISRFVQGKTMALPHFQRNVLQ
jgi:hypothetical protein